MAGSRSGVLLKKSRVIGYVRLSIDPAKKDADKEGGLGLDAQRELIESTAKARDWRLLRVEEDVGRTGANLDRPGMQRALASLEAGKADILAVAKLDRLSRDLGDFAGLVSIAREQGWQLVALDVGLDMSTPIGELTASILAAFAQYERHAIADRTKKSLAQAKKRGTVLGRPRDLPEHVAEYIIGLREDGLGWRAIATKLETEDVPTARGGKRWYPSTIKSIVRSRRPDLIERSK